MFNFSCVPEKIQCVLEKSEFVAPYYAVALGFEPGYIFDIIDGRESPTLEFIEGFSRLTNTDIEYLFGLVEYIDIEF